MIFFAAICIISASAHDAPLTQEIIGLFGQFSELMQQDKYEEAAKAMEEVIHSR